MITVIKIKMVRLQLVITMVERVIELLCMSTMKPSYQILLKFNVNFICIVGCFCMCGSQDTFTAHYIVVDQS